MKAAFVNLVHLYIKRLSSDQKYCTDVNFVVFIKVIEIRFD